jgi:RsiW-degrading membrane proteinase PrsW (M82 family)
LHVALLVALALGPPILLCVFFYLQDRWEPEPHAHVLAAFGIGMLAVAPALIIAQRLDALLPRVSASAVGDAFLLAAGVEETIKLVLLLASAYMWAEFDEPFDGIVYATAVALGFAATENALYVLRGGVSVAALRALFTVPGHGLCGALLGYYLGRAKFGRIPLHAPLWIAAGLFAAIAVHGTFDYVILVTARWHTLALLSALSVAMWVLVLHRMRRARAASPFLVQ